MNTLSNAIIRLLDKKVCTLDTEAKDEIKAIIESLTECEPIDIATDISDIEIFSTLDSDTISEMIEEEIIAFIAETNAEIMEEKATLSSVIIERAKSNYGDTPSSDTLIRLFTNITADNNYPAAEVHEVLHYIKSVIKKEMFSDLQGQIETFKTFQRI